MYLAQRYEWEKNTSGQFVFGYFAFQFVVSLQKNSEVF